MRNIICCAILAAFAIHPGPVFAQDAEHMAAYHAREMGYAPGYMPAYDAISRERLRECLGDRTGKWTAVRQMYAAPGEAPRARMEIREFVTGAWDRELNACFDDAFRRDVDAYFRRFPARKVINYSLEGRIDVAAREDVIREAEVVLWFREKQMKECEIHGRGFESIPLRVVVTSRGTASFEANFQALHELHPQALEYSMCIVRALGRMHSDEVPLISFDFTLPLFEE